MKTYQDLEACLGSEQELMRFVEAVITEHTSSSLYLTAQNADLYYKHQNPTIMAAQKVVYDMLGIAKADKYSANNKIPSAYYGYFVTQEVQFLLGNGVSFVVPENKAKLGKDFDDEIQEATTNAINAGVCFLFWNLDHVEVFPVYGGGSGASFAPLYDEETGALRAGVRFWQLDANKPLRATLYEPDGYTSYIKRRGEPMTVYEPKRSYIQVIQRSQTGTEIVEGRNYPSLPIIPLYNINRQSELIGNQEVIDAYDLMASALVNNVDDGNLIYWVLKNCGGMSPEDDAHFLEDLRARHVAHADGDDGAGIEARSVEAPFEANEAALERLRTQLFDDFMALDTRGISGGAATATQIRAAYEPLNAKADRLEYQVTRAINALLVFVGIDDAPSYTRSYIINKQDEITALTMCGEYLPREYITKKILEIMGDIDSVDQIERMMLDQEIRLTKSVVPENEEDEEDEGEEGAGDAE